jgi:hypothetical protein
LTRARQIVHRADCRPQLAPNRRSRPGVLGPPDTSIKAALEPVKLFECIAKGGCDVDSRSAVQPLYLQ